MGGKTRDLLEGSSLGLAEVIGVEGKVGGVNEGKGEESLEEPCEKEEQDI